MRNRISIRGIAVATATTVAVTASAFGVSALADSQSSAAELAPPAAALQDERFNAAAEQELAAEAADAQARALAKLKAEAKAKAAAEAKRKAKARAKAEAAARAAQLAERREAAERAQKRSSRSAARTSVVGSGTDQSIARSMVASRGWSSGEFSCLVDLWNRESGWRVTATNPSSGAYGIPQALPASKMASAGSDWRTSAQTQIEWGLSYIADRYGSPCSALSAWHSKGWY